LDVLDWDPRLGFVMLGAIAVHAPWVLWVRRRGRALMTKVIHVPANTRVDMRLIIGAAVFGVGWGLAGYCPGPALAAAATNVSALLLTASMLVGMLLHDRFMKRVRVRATRDAGAPCVEEYHRRQGVMG
jgi:uncharacterized membrane protein YedE/YeeE